MSVTTAALILAWLVIVVLAFALAAVIARLRALEAQVAEGLAAAGTSQPALAVQRVDQQRVDGESIERILLVVDQTCPACKELLPYFEEQAARLSSPRLGVVTYESDYDWSAHTALPVLVDDVVYRELDLPWRPGLAHVAPDGEVLGSRPVGSPEALEVALQEFGVEVRSAGRPDQSGLRREGVR